MKTQVNVNAIKSLHIRNLVRGMLANNRPSDMRLSLKKIAKSGTENDWKQTLEVLRGCEIFRSNGLSRYFQRKFSCPLADLNYKVSEIIYCIEQNSIKILSLLNDAETVINYINKRDYDSAIISLKAMAKNKGTSLFLVRLVYLIKNRCARPDLNRQIDQFLEEIQVGNIRYLHLAIRELSSPNTEYLNIREKLNSTNERDVSWVIKSFIDYIPRSEEEYINTLNSYFGISIIDAYLYYCSIERLNIFTNFEHLNQDLHSKFNSLASYEYLAFYSDDEDAGLEYFKDSFLLIEFQNCFNYRITHGALYSSTEENEFERIPLEKSLLSEFFYDLTSLEQVQKFGSRGTASFSSFERSNSLIYFLEKKDGCVEEEERFVELMSETKDIGLLCPKRHLDTMAQSANSYEFKLVVACLAYIKSKTQSSEHELRRIIQEIAVSKFDANLVKLLEHLLSISSAVSEHLIQSLDETFLSKLFQMVSKPNAAIEKRAEIFEWYGHLTKDVFFLERAKNLRIDVQISKEKGTIDDARIYVDPVKFTQWINDNLIDKLTILLANVTTEDEPAIVVLPWEKIKSGMTEQEQIGAILHLAYEEFCVNKKFGIASYIGRRIRHGTLKGTGFNDIKMFAERTSFRSLFSNHDFYESFTKWIVEYEELFNNLRDKHLQILDKSRPEGLISKDIRSSFKKNEANHLLYDVLKSFYTNRSGTEIPYIITEYCWRLIEEDLALIRKFMMTKKAQHGVFLCDVNKFPKSLQRDIQEFCQELNAITAEKFRLIESWFNKPSIASPSAELALLFRAVVSEVKGLLGNFDPILSIEEPGYVIKGGVYFVIYDALYILINNAATYGNPSGTLGFKVIVESNEKDIHFRMSISSEISECDDILDVKESIQFSLDGDCEDALITEGRSGIKKLRRMEQDGQIRDVCYSFENNYVTATFKFIVDYQS
jgi:hypothetical protein